ncbi:FAD/NAD(P)-binding protein [Pseudomonas chlororaphis]|uniref:FAD/NAD(P)-binding protein n=1 Tax=Pseudomonas chlororaphis TaxID=587753 RepID=UPI002365638D|nr:FAD/NAD(P)-binding protein [Pseudomonas chlororaphis]WDG52051.1 FAD/NAD(P)-binding protein [Pseudomonas chlororaphis]WDH86932.1 FAD/NAD(P)-binding protein [Pseudomonas chlororaphis]
MRTIVIVGAGFSGVALAIQLLRSLNFRADILLVNRSGIMARGLAFGTTSEDHLLNVPAGNMSAIVQEPNSFVDFCRENLINVDASHYLSRKVYGDYLDYLLRQAQACAGAGAGAGVLLKRVVGEVSDVLPDEDGAILTLESGDKIKADHVVLAFGHFKPRDPIEALSRFDHSQYQRDPWLPRDIFRGSKDCNLLLVGSGLTALDMISSLRRAGHRGVIYILSRRGLLPIPHREALPPSQDFDEFLEYVKSIKPSVLGYLRCIRFQTQLVMNNGGDWREVISALRPITPVLWQRLDSKERKRFLRHVSVYWDVHRHRVAPEPFYMLKQELAVEKVKVLAGRIRGAKRHLAQVRVEIELRAGRRIEVIDFGKVINCTGPSTDLRYVDEPLIKQLLESRLIQPDSEGLGIRVDENLTVTSGKGANAPWLSYIGPMLKAKYWEATAVPELRQHAKKLSDYIALKLA